MEEIYLSVFPIVQEESSQFSIAGTAILIQCDEIPFLITAAHVLKNNGSEYPLYFVIGDKFIPIRDHAYMSKIEDDIDTDIAIFDLGLCCELLHDELIEYGGKPFSLESPEGLPSHARSHYISIGFPWRKSKYKRKEQTLDIKPLQYVSNEVENNFYIKYNRPKEQFLIVDYRRRKTHDNNRKRKFAPKPEGTSGGAIFTVLVNEKDEIVMLIFEGLLIEWQNNEHFVATKKSTIKNFLIQNRLCIQR
jgi:hypothetical protein